MAAETWETAARKCRDILKKSVPAQYLMEESKLPSLSTLNVTTFPKESGMLSKKELEITKMSATTLAEKMGVDQFTAEEVVVAFLKRAVLGHQLLNFATEFMAEEAIARAKELDEYKKKTGKLIGPLHGVPISVKEHIGLKGRICNTGYVAWTSNIPKEDAYLVQLLKNAGAVFHVRTNQPQSLMHLDCTNNITGTTVNPYNRNLSPGGSSGGEGASTGFKCAALGIGTDIGGSIRAPAAFNGSYGFRPTAMRNPYKGIILAGDGRESIRCVVGPLASTCVEDLDLFMKTVIDQEPWDVETSLVAMPWRKVEQKKEFTVAIMWDDGIVKPHPPITRGLAYAKEKLEAAGVKVVDWEPYKHDHGWDIVSALYFPDTAACQKEILASVSEPILPLTQHAFNYSRPSPLTIVENWDLNVQRENYRAEYHALMKSRGVDFILSPTYLGVAAELGTPQYWNYTAIWNILDQPCVIFPTGLYQDPKVDVKVDYQPRGDVDAREWARYEPEKFDGAPIALQLTGKHWKDEETLAAGKIVAEIIKG
ncbi:amidase signature domain-containing protein [Amylocarpus encephaloides]|uniref:amidase n=1 Tax=Amylocarpus encephaloides TaxID=45428 RepID=A0A9P8C8K0_9HELO|nr:amidase signature domain-containing protein [Amylocarpus encephaloides]